MLASTQVQFMRTTSLISVVSLIGRRILPAASVVALVGALAFVAPPAVAETLDGSWRGNGTVKPAGGGSENVRCSMRFHQTKPDVFRFSGRCAGTAGKTNVSGVVSRSGPSLYSGTGTAGNGARGSISVSLRGSKPVVRVKATEGSARISLRR